MIALETPIFTAPQASQRDAITIDKTVVVTGSGHQVEVFTMTLGGETIELLPLRNWSQLDVYKWRARGKLPGTPAGLEITFDHVKVSSEIASTKEPGGAAKLQKLLNDWLALARGTAELAQQKAHPKQPPFEHEASIRPEDILPHFRVTLDKGGKAHINCLQGKETLATIGLNLPGINSLINQGLMHKPRTLQVGALHDWVELDGVFFSFERGNNDASKLEQALNERYRSTAALGGGKEVVVFTNAASPTGFDIQFAAKVGGIGDYRKRPLSEESLALLQTPERCGLLPKDLVIKLSPPNLIFKRKTPDGGERSLDEGPETVVTVRGEEGEVRFIDLSRPVNYLRLTAMDLTAVFNHPAINQHSKASSQPSGASVKPGPIRVALPPAVARPTPSSPTEPHSSAETKPVEVPTPKPEVNRPKAPVRLAFVKTGGGEATARSAQVIRPMPNLWLEAIFQHLSTRRDWVTCLIYRQMAEHFGNSSEAMFGPIPCWACSLGGVDDVCDPAFHGVFLTQKGGLAYLNHGHIARFHNEVAIIGTLESTIEGIGVHLRAVGADSQQRIVFIVAEGFGTLFGIPEHIVAEQLTHLREYGALVLSVTDVLASPEPIEVVWAVPAEQEDPDDPQAVESLSGPGHKSCDVS
jgi:hypothetical protein